MVAKIAFVHKFLYIESNMTYEQLIDRLCEKVWQHLDKKVSKVLLRDSFKMSADTCKAVAGNSYLFRAKLNEILHSKYPDLSLNRIWTTKHYESNCCFVCTVHRINYDIVNSTEVQFAAHPTLTARLSLLEEQSQRLEKQLQRFPEVMEKVDMMYYAPGMPGSIAAQTNFEKLSAIVRGTSMYVK